MNFNNKPQDIEALPSEYPEFYHNLRTKLADERIITDPVRTFAYGVDASLYRITPKMVVKVNNEVEAAFILQEAQAKHIAVTFRAAGTSLCGQALTDSVLVIINEGWQHYEIADEGKKITLEPGVLGSLANLYLRPFYSLFYTIEYIYKDLEPL